MPTTKDNVLLVTLKKNQHAPGLQLLPKSSAVGRWKFASAFLAFHKPTWRSAWSTSCAVTQSSLRVHERPQERLHSCKKIVLECRLSGPSSVVLRSISQEVHRPGRSILLNASPAQTARDGNPWSVWLAVNYRVLIGAPAMRLSWTTQFVFVFVLHSTSCIFTLSDKKVRLRCFEVRRHQLTGTHQGHKSILNSTRW